MHPSNCTPIERRPRGASAAPGRRPGLPGKVALPCLLGRAMLGVLLVAGAAHAQKRDPWTQVRASMVENEVVAAGVKDARVCDAMRAVPRHEFVPVSMRRYAYFDISLPIGEGQTIS
jgi:hypothetical protein